MKLNIFVSFYLLLGQKPLSGRLKSTAVPSIFSWKKELSRDESSRASRAEKRTSSKRKFDETCKDELEASCVTDCQEETVHSEQHDDTSECESYTLPVSKDTFTQTDKQPMFSVENFEKDDEAVHYYTGLETYIKFIIIHIKCICK